MQNLNFESIRITMNNKNLIITGADGALGRVVAAKLLSDGWTLHASVFDEKSKETLKNLFPDSLEKTIFPTITDLSDEKDVQKFISGVNDIFGLVHLAGGYKGAKSVVDYSTGDFDFLMKLNTKPTFLLMKEIIPQLKKKNEGSIVVIGAKPVIHQTNENALYTASKSAAVAITLSVAEECREFNIRANCILPATLQTKNNLSWASEEEFKTFTPLEDVADIISFLMSEKSKGITGMTIPMYNKVEW